MASNYQVVYASNGTPVSGKPGGSWVHSGRGGKWILRARVKDVNGEWKLSDLILPAAFCDIDNINGVLKFKQCFINPDKVEGTAIKNGYCKIGGSFAHSAKDITLIFQAELKDVNGNWVQSAMSVKGTSPINFENVNGHFQVAK